MAWQQQQERQQRQQQQQVNKENVAERAATPELGLVARLGQYDKTRQQLNEQRRLEYNQLLAEVLVTKCYIEILAIYKTLFNGYSLNSQ
jgi:hypothetical protein